MIQKPIVQAIEQTLAAHLRSRTEWDEPPVVFTIQQSGPDSVVLVHIPVPRVVWDAHGHPPTVVANLAATVHQLPRHPDGTHLLVHQRAGKLLGVGFRYEAYTLAASSDAPAVQEAVRRRKAGGSVPRFREIVGRREERCITAVDLDGGRYMVTATRIEQAKSEATEPRTKYLAFSDPKRDTLTGNVVDATIRLLNAIKPLPIRDDPGGHR
ncbi:hypothetical protein ABZX77_30385 [Streptomyces sp. NPDC004237]|uniref:hypothetical protein n=1 Tax=Streptomyces sp. NPDC004237 TaxID=3154455 RepID=UPI0033AD0E55